MIHSLAGGNLGKVSYADFAKVRICDGLNAGEIYWYICNVPNLKEGDKVFVSLRDRRVKGEVLRVDKKVSSQCAPVPFSKAKSILSKIQD